MIGEPEVVILPDADAVASVAAGRLAASLRAAAEARGRADWATTGGSAPTGIYRLLTRAPLNDEVPWSRVHLWWSDDRYVPSDHPLSNVLPAEQILLHAAGMTGESGGGETYIDTRVGRDRPVGIPLEQVHPIAMGEAIGAARGPAWAAARYEEELRSSGIAVENGWPVFDACLLGVGPDGHVLSVFPGSDTFDRSEWALAIPAPSHVEPHVSRVSLNPHVLDVARAVLVVVTGASKAPAVAAIFGPERDPRRWPAQLVRRPGVTWLLDSAAAAALGAEIAEPAST